MASPQKVNYSQSGSFDRKIFLDEFAKEFASNPHYNPGAAQNLLALLGMIEKDRDITDVRWTAYMLATTMLETTTPARLERPALGKKGKPVLDKKGKPVMVKYTKWIFSMAPVDEVGHGAGRAYHDPVKVKLLPDGNVRVTEHSGVQFLVTPKGGMSRIRSHGKTHTPARLIYEKDDGNEQVYFGRGYVQLTWWSNYLAAGIATGYGSKFLLDPEAVKDPAIAYKIMSYGMENGKIFAHNSFGEFFTDKKSDYKGARKMVNGHDRDDELADIAKKFEKILLSSLSRPTTAPPSPPKAH